MSASVFLEKLKESFDKNVIKAPVANKVVDAYPSMFRNTLAFSIDFAVLSIARMAIIMAASIVMNSYRLIFVKKFNSLFGDVSHFDITMKAHRQILLATSFGKGMIILCIICVLMGMVYNCYMLQSKWGATLGRRAVSIYIARPDGSRITLLQSIIRTVLNYIPWFLPILAYYTWFDHRYIAILALLLSCFWSDTYVFSGRRVGIHDMIVNTRPYIGRRQK